MYKTVLCVGLWMSHIGLCFWTVVNVLWWKIEQKIDRPLYTVEYLVRCRKFSMHYQIWKAGYGKTWSSTQHVYLGRMFSSVSALPFYSWRKTYKWIKKYWVVIDYIWQVQGYRHVLAIGLPDKMLHSPLPILCYRNGCPFQLQCQNINSKANISLFW